jgi:hypothetical protein
MNNVLLLNSLTQLANAIHTLGYHLQSHEDKDAVYGHLQMFEKQVAQLRSELQTNSSTQPQLNKASVSDGWQELTDVQKLNRGDIVRHVGGQGYSFLIDTCYGGRATGVCSVDITNAKEWEVMPANRR